MKNLQTPIDVDLKAWLSKYTETRQATATEFRINCPKSDCKNRDFKLYINTDKNVWICHRCNWGRGIKDVSILLAEVSNRNINDVRSEINKFVLPALQQEEFLDKLEETLYPKFKPKKKLIISSKPIEIPGTSNTDSVVYKQVLEYAYFRGLNDGELASFKVRASGVLRSHTGPYIVFPIINEGNEIGYQGRRLIDAAPKYVSCDNIADLLFPIDSVHVSVYKQNKEIVLVEGIFDAIAMWRCGIPAVCTFGKKISKMQIGWLIAFGIKKVVLAYDLDAGKEVEHYSKWLKSFFDVYVVDLTKSVTNDMVTKLDPGAVLQNPQFTDWLKSRVENAFSVNSHEFFQWKLKRSLFR